MNKKLQRDEKHKMLGGVMAGFSNYFKQDVTIWRLGIVLLALVTAVIPVLVFYFIAWFVMPPKDKVNAEGREGPLGDEVEYTVVE